MDAVVMERFTAGFADLARQARHADDRLMQGGNALAANGHLEAVRARVDYLNLIADSGELGPLAEPLRAGLAHTTDQVQSLRAVLGTGRTPTDDVRSGVKALADELDVASRTVLASYDVHASDGIGLQLAHARANPSPAGRVEATYEALTDFERASALPSVAPEGAFGGLVSMMGTARDTALHGARAELRAAIGAEYAIIADNLAAARGMPGAEPSASPAVENAVRANMGRMLRLDELSSDLARQV